MIQDSWQVPFETLIKTWGHFGTIGYLRMDEVECWLDNKPSDDLITVRSNLRRYLIGIWLRQLLMNIWMWRVPGFFPVCSLTARMEERQTTSRKVMNNVNNRSEVYVSGDRRKAGGTRKIQRQLALSDSPIEPSHGRKLPLIRNSDSWPRQRLSTEQGAESFENVNFLIHPIHIEFDYEMNLTDEVTLRAIAILTLTSLASRLHWQLTSLRSHFQMPKKRIFSSSMRFNCSISSTFMCYVSVRYGIAYSSCCCMLFHNVPMDPSSYMTHRLVLLVGNFRCQVYIPGL